jgi:hypothetical protein
VDARQRRASRFGPRQPHGVRQRRLVGFGAQRPALSASALSSAFTFAAELGLGGLGLGCDCGCGCVLSAALLEPGRVRRGELVSLPYSMEINDSIAWRRGMEAADFAQKIRDEFDTLYAEGGRVMNIAVHHFIMGQPHRIGALSEALDYILGHSGVWCATGAEIVDAWRAQQPKPTPPHHEHLN